MDVLFRVLHLEEKELGNHGIGDVVVDGGAKKNNAVLEQAGVDVVALLTAARALHDIGHRIVPGLWRRGNVFGIIESHKREI